ncbi:lytic transglycosylase domain-containing protein [Nocardiopsis sp. EMB25]|uniref:lytic transglycosylase domain-containing protein n=1 Tax=Nocardiopsis sp. EMB25 TaxID=2835867 RepID=UPI0022852476|nr:lytic transglycosylase domain-containing protein [Nocardiopsis sp. EMB25]MCY9785869.1 lytic transglycosylase domain-containing protein [Nocardiopsis sp. EMB25]
MAHSERRGARWNGPLAAVCVALAVCLLLTGGIVYTVGRISTAMDGWEGPSGLADGGIATPPAADLTGPPARAEVNTEDGPREEPKAGGGGAGDAGSGADERQSPGAGVLRPTAAWLDEVSEATRIPRRALEGYASAQLAMAERQPSCQLSWPTLAGIGYVESRHGTYAGGEIGPDGTTTVDIIGIPLNGDNNTRAIADTDGGELDGDERWDRAVGPMQFIPRTWDRWGAALEGGTPDPHDIDDAALSAARYLCAQGRDLTVAADWESAILEYNSSTEYVNDVLAYAHAYADAT